MVIVRARRHTWGHNGCQLRIFRTVQRLSRSFLLPPTIKDMWAERAVIRARMTTSQNWTSSFTLWRFDLSKKRWRIENGKMDYLLQDHKGREPVPQAIQGKMTIHYSGKGSLDWNTIQENNDNGLSREERFLSYLMFWGQPLASVVDDSVC